jgi:CO/xanthine dehydrogenase Mo-binding subunit
VTFQFLVAKELSIRLERIRVMSDDTDACPFDFRAIGSRTTQAMGVAVCQAINGVKKQLLGFAEQLLKNSKEDLEFGIVNIFVRGHPEAAIPIDRLATILSAAGGRPVVAGGTNTTPNPPFSTDLVDGSTLASNKPEKVYWAMKEELR